MNIFAIYVCMNSKVNINGGKFGKFNMENIVSLGMLIINRIAYKILTIQMVQTQLY